MGVKDRLRVSKQVLHDAEQQKRTFLGLWGSELGHAAALRSDYNSLQGSVAEIMRHDAAVATEIDELGSVNEDLQHTLSRTVTAQAQLDRRISSFETKSARDLVELRMTAQSDRAMVGQLQASAAELSWSQAAN